MKHTQLVRSCIQTLHCSTPATFKEIWADDGPYLWSKFIEHFDANEGSFLCYLDEGNLTKLLEHINPQTTLDAPPVDKRRGV